MPAPSVFAAWFDTLKQCELGGMIGLAAAALAAPARLAAAVARAFCRALDAVADRPVLAVALPGLLSFAGAALAGLLLRYPEPEIHDEFSYLLAGDTFAHGRLANPPHPMWRHFESFHVIQQPTYQSKYPPAQGTFLALGQRATGDPIAGVWLSTALAMSAFAWMFRGWLPARWAAWGSLLVLLRVGVTSYWAQAYWGGAVAALGGALVWGAYPRLRSSPNVRDSLWLALGLAVLSNARPFEGLVVSLPVAAALAWQFARTAARAAWLARVAAPVALVLAADAAWILAYNRAVTGSATTMPYFVHAEQYAQISQWVFGKRRPAPAYRHAEMREYYEGQELPFHERQQTAGGFLAELPRKIVGSADVPYAGLMLLPVVFAAGVWRRRRTRLAIAGFGAALAAAATLTIFIPHYGAPATPCGFLLVVQGLRHLHAARLGARRFGRLAAVGATATAVGLLAYLLWLHSALGAWGHVRAHVQQTIEDLPGKHLVVVRYGPPPGHLVHNEWVYNGADIDGARVVWARDMGDDGNRELIAYFLAQGRKIWLMEVANDAELPEPRPYPGLK